MGTAVGQICAEEVRSTGQEGSCSKDYEPGRAKEVIGTSEGALGCEEEGWRYDALESELAATISIAEYVPST